MRKPATLFKLGTLLISILMLTLSTYGQTRGVESGNRYERLIIRNVMVVDGNGTPASGPVDIVVEGNTIQSLRGVRPGADPYGSETHVLDGTGMYALPGLSTFMPIFMTAGVLLPFLLIICTSFG